MKHLSLDLADTCLFVMRVMCTSTKLACRKAFLVRLVPQFTYQFSICAANSDTCILQLHTGAR